MLRRKAYDDMLAWRNDPNRRALLVTGARQVGKTYLVRRLARETYAHSIEINLAENPQAARAFSSARDSADLLARITAFANGPMVPGETLVFIDEVQESQEVVTAVKFLVERGDFDYVLSGSLLGVELGNVRSWPVGYLAEIEMYPLDFEEFCWAVGLAPETIGEVQGSIGENSAVPDYLHDIMMARFYDYLVVGGMPAAVEAFVESGSIQVAHGVLSQISNLYRADISKYAGERARPVRRIYDLMPAELSSQSKRFTVKQIEGVARVGRYENDFLWIADAGVALPCYNVTEPRAPLLMNMESRRFKLFCSDVGMLSQACGMQTVRSLIADRVDVNYGAVYENFVAQQFAAHGHRLFYFSNRTVGELDFLLEEGLSRVVPVEVKSGKAYRRHNALVKALSTPNYGIERAIVLHDGNVEKGVRAEHPVSYLPIYSAAFL